MRRSVCQGNGVKHRGKLQSCSDVLTTLCLSYGLAEPKSLKNQESLEATSNLSAWASFRAPRQLFFPQLLPPLHTGEPGLLLGLVCHPRSEALNAEGCCK